ncbi:MAG: LuxR C-terminal-related transcriptional regulator [Chloroflexota bacterium]
MGGHSRAEDAHLTGSVEADTPEARLVPFRPPRQELPTGNLPLSLTRLVGRDEEIDGTHRELEDHRLVTLVGPGGVGKTRLALEVARARMHRHPDGVWLVDLSQLTDATLVPWAIASVVGVQERPGRPLAETLVDALRHRNLLLVVDNCEHLVDASARMVDGILRNCARVSILATSREALAIGGEVARTVAPLATPPADESISVASLSLLPSVCLFVERAASAWPAFRLSAQNASDVSQICRRLDGLPLAIELAAARVSSLTVSQIADRLDDRFRLLTTGSRTAPPRHQTLLATLDWSFDLLSEPEQTLLRRVAIFVNGWTLEASERVVSEDLAGKAVLDPATASSWTAEAPSVLELLARLVARSLVRVDHIERADGQSHSVRYRLLETVRQYAWQRLEAANEVESTRQRHAAWCVELAEEAEAHLQGREQVEWLVRLDEEHDNIRAGASWCLERDPELGLRLAAALGPYWRVRLHLAEGRRLLEGMLAVATNPPPVRIRALIAAGMLAHWQLDGVAARTYCEESLALARALGDPRLLGRSLRDLGIVLSARFGDNRRAAALFEEGLTHSKAVDDRRTIATNLQQQARLACVEGEYRRAQQLLNECIALLSDVGDQWQLAIALEDAGGVALIIGQPDRATTFFEESLATAQAIERAGVRTIHRRYHLGSVALWSGDAESAIVWYEDGLALTREYEHTAGIADNLAGFGRAVLLLNDVARATTLLQESLDLATASADRSRIGLALHGLGLAAWRAGDLALALERLRESLSLRHELHEQLGIAECLDSLGAVALAGAADIEAARRALRWIAAADALREQLGAPRPPVDQVSYDSAIEAAAAWLDDIAAKALAGWNQPLNDVIADALGRKSTTAPSADPARTPPPATSANMYPAGLSAREVEVLRLVSAGRTNAEIAQILVVSANTVRHHVTHILDKTGCENRAAATAFALRHNLA